MVSVTGPRLQRRLEAALAAVLPPTVEPHFEHGPEEGTATARLGSATVSIRWIGRGSLRAVRAVLAGCDRPDIIVGSEMSLAARQAASAAGVGWVDETGAAEIATGAVLVARDGSRRERPRSDRWTPATIGVAEAVLCAVTPTVNATAEATGYSISTAGQALAMLTGLGLLEAPMPRGRSSGRQLVDPDRLLDAYADAAAQAGSKTELRCGVVWRNPWHTVSAIGERWDHMGIAWTATGALAAALIAPHLSDIPGGELYVDVTGMPELRTVARGADLEAINGGRLVLRPFPTAATRRLSSASRGINVAPWPRVYADLRRLGVRGEEAAEHLRELRRGR